MPRQSSIKKLPPEIRDKIGALLDQGRTLTEIVTHLSSLDVQVSRSALGRYKQHIDKVSERIRRSREIAEAIVRNQGDAPESKTARLNIELLHGVLNDMLMQVPTPEEAEAAEKDGDGEAAAMMLTLSPRGAMELAKAVDHLSRASKQDADLITKMREEAQQQAAKQMEKAVKEAARKDGGKTSAEEVLKRIKAIYRGEA